MKTLLIGINAKFIHSNLAIRYIKKYYDATEQLAEFESPLELVEYSINQHLDYILTEIIEKNPQVVTFSCYLWNIEMVRKLSGELKKILPEITIVYGGPEVSYTSTSELEETLSVDYIINGEGEETFHQLMGCLNGYHDLPKVGLTYRSPDGIVELPPSNGLDMGDIPFPYDNELTDLDNRILYYETSRGCPFNCQYCLSSIEKGVRFRPMNMVEEELQFFLDKKVRQVKFVDRTFNTRQDHALAIMNYIIEHDNGVTNFHFEVAPELLKDGFIECLSKARKGLFQLEIGVQTINEETLSLIKRKNVLPLITDAVERVHNLGNTHMHLDLIAGLPAEDYESFERSFDYVYGLRPHQLQLGFLKVLKGSGMMELKEAYGIVHRDYPPYQVLKTGVLSFSQLKLLNMVEEMVEIFYNSGQFRTTMEAYMKGFESAFKGYEKLALEWMDRDLHHTSNNKLALYQFLYDVTGDGDRLILDYCLSEKPRKKLDWMDYAFLDASLQRFILDTVCDMGYWTEESEQYTSKQLSRMYHMDQVKHHLDEIEGLVHLEASHETYDGEYMVINYKRRDFIHHHGQVITLTIRQK